MNKIFGAQFFGVSIGVCLLNCLLFLSVPVDAEIYKTVDKNGKVTYTNVPPDGTKSEVMDVKKPLILPPTPNVYYPSNNQNRQYSVAYEIAITSPASGLELSPEQRSISVDVRLNQSLDAGISIAYKIDGNTVTTTTETQYVINEPPRGEHKLIADVVNEKGQVLASSQPVTFLVIRPLLKTKVPPKKH